MSCDIYQSEDGVLGLPDVTVDHRLGQLTLLVKDT